MDYLKRLRQRMGSSQFTEAEVARIKYLLAKGHSRRQLAKAYDVALGTISKIAREETFAWVAPDSEARLGEEILGSEPVSDELKAQAEASFARLQAMLSDEPRRAAPPIEVPRYVPPPPAVETPESAITLMKRTFDSDQALMHSLSSTKRIPFTELQNRYAACKGDRAAISGLFNEIAKSQPRDILDSLLGDQK